ncbi:TetR/AcrR family transcriptional regulator [Saccharopolyspora sp. NPDC049357]|uniref:TetR/AcrR family transcriptional regulator n=1 Tax=Saccharopolyspora sp. NPDC049357 TaxID=3154507 RepID=UPI0034329CBB
MSAEPPRRRASAMSPEQRREAIVTAVLPLVREHGAHVTTKQIAHAAGIAEGTVFRAFADKTELLHACVTAALRPDELCATVRAVPRDIDVAARLTEAAQLFLEHFTSFGELVHTLAASGFDLRGGPGGKPAGLPEVREQFIRDLTTALASLVDPQELRIPAEDLASYLQALVLGIRFTATASATSEVDHTAAIRARVDVLLHGALAETTDPQESR